PFGELSFGQQRLVLLARAAVKRPRLIILDEPCQGLDTQQRQTLLAAVDRTIQQTGASLIFVSHHEDELPRSITHVLRLKRGRIREAREVIAPRNTICEPGGLIGWGVSGVYLSRES
ncbi:MAG: ATP-binding cassette domain-containing protein, partial [Verrucomicrobia bacterium]|nr:ATP-binding cassette domain-containing protein [Verrucomicrobiota bacterium]